MCGWVVYTEYEISEGKTVATIGFTMPGDNDIPCGDKVSKLDSDVKGLRYENGKLTIKINFRKSIGGSCVVEFNTAVGYLIDYIVESYNNVNEVELDLSDSDFSNILSGDDAFYSEAEGRDYRMTIKMPKGKGQIKPVSACSMFENKHIVDADSILSNINFECVIKTEGMFRESGIHRADLSEIKAPNLIDASYMFDECLELTDIKMGKFLEGVSPDINNMFFRCKSLRNIDVNNILSYVTPDMKMYGIFENCPNIDWYTQRKKIVQLGGELWLMKYTDVFRGFLFNTGAKYIDMRGFGFRNNIDEWICSVDYLLTEVFDRSNLPDIIVLSLRDGDKFSSRVVNKTINVLECEDDEVELTVNKLKLFGGKHIILVKHK